MTKSDQTPCGDTAHRTCRRDKVRAAVAARILDGTYPPGTHLKEMALAREFETSQGPVREALRELEMLGLVASERFRGTRVLSPSGTDLREAYELRAAIEWRSAQLAVPCRPEDLDRLAAYLGEMMATAAGADLAAYSAAAVGFHRQIVAMSGNRTFLHTWDSQHWEVRALIASHRAKVELPAFAQAHGHVLNALRQGDGMRAATLLMDMFEQMLRQHSEPAAETR